MTLLLALALLLTQAKDEVVVDGDLGKALDAAVTKQMGAKAWGSILVAKGGKVLLAKGYGSADYDMVANTPRTLFEIASSSKMFTATAILKLEMQEKLALSDPISKFFKDVPDDKKEITVRHLLNHTSGFTVEALLPYQSSTTADEFVALAMKTPLTSKIGGKFAYSNPGYALLGVIVEKASGQTMEKYLAENLFSPAGLTDTGFVQDKTLDARRASTRRDRDRKKVGTAIEWGWGWGYKGMGGIVTTCWDLFRFDQAMRAGKILGAEAQKKQLVTGQGGYALGCSVETTDRGTTKMSHSGSVAGYLAMFARYLDDDAVVIILSNGDCNLHGLEKALSSILFPPATLTLTIDVNGRKLNEHGGLILKDGLSWKAAKEGEAVILSLETATGAPIKASFGKAAAQGLMKVVQKSIDERTKAGEKDDGSLEAGVFTLRLGLKEGRVEVRNAGFTLMPGYNGRDDKGKDVVDNRMTLIFTDAATGQWPLMAHMSITSAKQLVKALKDAIGE